MARRMLESVVLVPFLLLAGMTAAVAKGTGYVFVSHEKTNNIAVIDPRQDYKIIKWIETSHRPRDMNFRDNRTQLLVACGDDDVIDIKDISTTRSSLHPLSRIMNLRVQLLIRRRMLICAIRLNNTGTLWSVRQARAGLLDASWMDLNGGVRNGVPVPRYA